MSSNNELTPAPASETDFDQVDAILEKSKGKQEADVTKSCRSFGVEVELVDLDQNPWGEVQNDKRDGRVRLWVRSGIVVMARRG